MDKKIKCNLVWDNLDYKGKKGENLSIPVLNVNIEGVITIFDINNMMTLIKKETNNYTKPYVSITDYSKVDLNKTLQKLILIGMESPLKKLMAVKNPALFSFILVKEGQEAASFMKSSLERINNSKADADYTYNYVFLTDRLEIPKILSKVMNEK